jgi:L-ectoine synthase
MIVRSVREVIGTTRDVHGEGWKSRRLLLKEDGLSVSVHETTLAAGAELRFNYVVHSETVYCVKGRGSVEDLDAGVVHTITPGTIYTVFPGDDHIVRADTEITFLCIFDPPCIADESAD